MLLQLLFQLRWSWQKPERGTLFLPFIFSQVSCLFIFSHEIVSAATYDSEMFTLQDLLWGAVYRIVHCIFNIISHSKSDYIYYRPKEAALVLPLVLANENLHWNFCPDEWLLLSIDPWVLLYIQHICCFSKEGYTQLCAVTLSIGLLKAFSQENHVEGASWTEFTDAQSLWSIAPWIEQFSSVNGREIVQCYQGFCSLLHQDISYVLP